MFRRKLLLVRYRVAILALHSWRRLDEFLRRPKVAPPNRGRGRVGIGVPLGKIMPGRRGCSASTETVGQACSLQHVMLRFPVGSISYPPPSNAAALYSATDTEVGTHLLVLGGTYRAWKKVHL